MAKIKVHKAQWEKGSKLTKEDKDLILENLPESIGTGCNKSKEAVFGRGLNVVISIFREKTSLFRIQKTTISKDAKIEPIEEVLKVTF